MTLTTEFTHAQYRLLGITQCVLGAISMGGCAVIIASFARFRSLRTFAFEQVLNLAVADLLACVTYVLGSPRDGSALCTFQAMLQQFAETASVAWTTVIAFTLYSAILRGSDARAHRARFYAYGWGAPALLALLPLATRSYGAAGGWCWLRARGVAGLSRFALFYAPLWMAVAFNSAIYLLTVRTLARLSLVAVDDASRHLRRTMRRLRFYPLILVLGWSAGTASRVIERARGRAPFWLFELHVATRTLVGAANAGAYGLSKAVRAEWALSCGTRADGASARGGGGGARGGGGAKGVWRGEADDDDAGVGDTPLLPVPVGGGESSGERPNERTRRSLSREESGASSAPSETVREPPPESAPSAPGVHAGAVEIEVGPGSVQNISEPLLGSTK